jgi:hypothetical protein
MSFLDVAVASAFRDEQAGRVVVPVGLRRRCGYLVRSSADEHKIRAFLKLFLFAQMTIQTLGLVAAFGVANVGRQWNQAATLHDVIVMALSFVVAYALLAILPLVLLFATYRHALASFFSAQDQVPVGPAPVAHARWLAIAAVGAVTLLLALGIWLAIRAR